MGNIFKISTRNLFRYKRRTALTASLIAIGVILVIVFSGVASSFKNEIIGVLTNSNLADIQIHRKGYLSSIDNLPLHLSMNKKNVGALEKIINNSSEIEAYTERIRFGAAISNYDQTTNLRLTAIYPKRENGTCPDLVGRITPPRDNTGQFLAKGEIVVPANIAKGLKLEIGSDVVLVANNKDGSVNAVMLIVSGVSENVLGPSGKDGYMHMEDAVELLQQYDGKEITEIAIKLKDFNKLDQVYAELSKEILPIKNQQGKQVFEVSTWEDLSPFTSIARIVDLLIIVVKIVLISIVLVSILNVMMMSVYERVSEIGTIAAIGTSPRNIMTLFLVEGFSLGVFSSIAGSILALLTLLILNLMKLNFTFGRMEVSLSPTINPGEVIVTIIIVVAISVLSTLQPAIKASQLEPVDALRYV